MLLAFFYVSRHKEKANNKHISSFHLHLMRSADHSPRQEAEIEVGKNWPSPMEAMMGWVGGGGGGAKKKCRSALTTTLSSPHMDWTELSSPYGLKFNHWTELFLNCPYGLSWSQLPIWVQGPEVAHCPVFWPISPLPHWLLVLLVFSYLCTGHQADTCGYPTRISLIPENISFSSLVFLVFIVLGRLSYC